MLQFHGVLNCILFGGAITIATYFFMPKMKHVPFNFPRSKVTGIVEESPDAHYALVDHMEVFVNKSAIPKMLTDFYERTTDYQLTATVKWSTWFKQFAFVFQWISKWMQQLNLPFHAKPVRMDGKIFKLNCEQDLRSVPRVWQRKIDGETVFSAIYSIHYSNSIAYMNIALPLPKSTLHGILTVKVNNNQLYLTSDDRGDAGTYLTIRDYTMKLP